MNKPTLELSFEFFPPRSPEAEARLLTTVNELCVCKPEFFSVTFGAGGSTREKTLETVLSIREQTPIESVPHISCIGFPVEDIRQVLQRYRDNGFKSLVALRGDLPSGAAGGGSLRYANELVEFIRAETGDHFRLYVACYPEVHPQSHGVARDMDNFKRKVDAGADAAITQYFYNIDAYLHFLESCRSQQIDIPIIPGVMPIINCTQLLRFSEACGAEVPRWITKRLQDFGDDRASIKKFGIEVTTHLCEQLIKNGADNLHIYTMNQSEASLAIRQNLGLDG
ncbi:MAG: methylenetetrahydrofolate reductase [NAD(P)H] [Gammaproteobacteria bacterium]